MNVKSTTVPKQQTHHEVHFPLVLTPSDSVNVESARAWIAEQRNELLESATKHGAVLLRDFGVSDAYDFDRIVQALSLENFPYNESLSNAVRINRTERVFSANEAPPEAKILFHHEMAQTPLSPKWILFSCEVAADEGGATPLCRSDILYERLAQACPEFVSDCERKGLQYSNVMPAENDAQSSMGRSWKSTLGVESQDGAEHRLMRLGYTWEWQADGCLKATSPALPAVLNLGENRKSFFNQLIAAFCGWSDQRNDPSDAIRHGDGSKLDQSSVMRAAKIADELAFDHNWKVGDIVIVDNRVTMHARRAFKGTRKVVASLAEAQQNVFQESA
jgi:alpha-ketoglutarate-dependent taurine dioxygenase